MRRLFPLSSTHPPTSPLTQVVRHPHRLLVTLVLVNAAAMEALPIFLDRLTDPITAVVLSTTVVLLFGEVAPQAICSRYGLAVGAYCVWFVRALMAVSWPIAAPLAAILDALLGEGETALFRRAQLKALVDAHGEGEGLGGNLTGDEIAVIRGALDLSSKTAAHCLTPLDKIFALPADARLDADTLARVVASGHSRIPVHTPGRKDAVVGMLLAKELILVDYTRPPRVGDLNVRALPFLRADTRLYDMLRLFESGRCHMAVLVSPPREESDTSSSDGNEPSPPLKKRSAWARLTDGEALAQVLKARGDRAAARARVAARGAAPLAGDSDTEAAGGDDDAANGAAGNAAVPPSSSSSSSSDGAGHVLGIVTIEDVIEELIGAEIVDETDQWMDNDRTTRVNAAALTARLPANLRILLRESAPRVAPPARGGGHRGLPVAPNSVVPRVGAHPAVGGWALPPSATFGGGGGAVAAAAAVVRARSVGPSSRRGGRTGGGDGLGAPLLGDGDAM